MFRGVLNLVLLFERLDFLSELLPSLEQFFPLFLTRVDRSPIQCSLEPLGALLLVLKELRQIQFALPEQLGLFLTEFLAQLASFLEEDFIVLHNFEAMFFILRKREPNRAFFSFMMCDESISLVIFKLGLSGVPGFDPGCRIRDELEADSLVILIIALEKVVVGKPLETEAIEFSIFKAASVNASIR